MINWLDQDCISIDSCIYDCNDVCNGTWKLSCDGICYDPDNGLPENILDCRGVCGGRWIEDCLNLCHDPATGPSKNQLDCSGVCNGKAYINCKGECIKQECIEVESYRKQNMPFCIFMPKNA